MHEFINMVRGNTLTFIICIIILIVFAFFLINVIKICIWNVKFRKLKTHEEIKIGKHTSRIFKRYEATIVFPDKDGNMKTDEEAESYFNLYSILSEIRINQRLMNAGSGLLVGLGLLGTFIGLTIGVMDFDSTSTEAIQNSINELLNGMGTAFATSLVGMACSLLFIIFDKISINGLQRNLDHICSILDEEYYIPQPEKYSLIYERQNQNLINLFTSTDDNGKELKPGNALRQLLDISKRQNKDLTYLINLFTSTDDKGNEIKPGNALRELLDISKRQNKDLTDLFEEIIFTQTNKAMQESLKPLVEQVNQVAMSLGQKLDSFANSVKSPGDNMANGIVKDLKDAIDKMARELKSSVSDSMSGKIDGLENAVKSLATFPSQVESMTQSMVSNFSNIESLVNKLANNTASTNDEIINSVKEQIGLATTNMSNLTQNLQTTMDRIDKQFSESSSASAEKLNDMLKEVERVVSEINGQAQQTSNSIIQQQKSTNEQSDELLRQFQTSINNAKAMLDEVKNTLGQFNALQIETNEATSHLSQVSKNASNATSSLHEAQTRFNEQCRDNIEKNILASTQIQSALDESKKLPNLYVHSFADIQDSLKDIFKELADGLTQYSQTVKENTQKVLDSYTNSVTEGIQQLSGAIDSLGSLVEEITDIKPSNTPIRR